MNEIFVHKWCSFMTHYFVENFERKFKFFGERAGIMNGRNDTIETDWNELWNIINRICSADK